MSLRNVYWFAIIGVVFPLGVRAQISSEAFETHTPTGVLRLLKRVKSNLGSLVSGSGMSVLLPQKPEWFTNFGAEPKLEKTNLQKQQKEGWERLKELGGLEKQRALSAQESLELLRLQSLSEYWIEEFNEGEADPAMPPKNQAKGVSLFVPGIKQAGCQQSAEKRETPRLAEKPPEASYDPKASQKILGIATELVKLVTNTQDDSKAEERIIDLFKELNEQFNEQRRNYWVIDLYRLKEILLSVQQTSCHRMAIDKFVQIIEQEITNKKTLGLEMLTSIQYGPGDQELKFEELVRNGAALYWIGPGALEFRRDHYGVSRRLFRNFNHLLDSGKDGLLLLVRLLLDRFKEPNSGDLHPLIQPIYDYRELFFDPFIRNLFQKGDEEMLLNLMNTEKFPPIHSVLMAALEMRYYRIVKWIIECRPDYLKHIDFPVHFPNVGFENRSLLQIAILTGDSELLKLALDQKANPNISFNSRSVYAGLIPLHVAVILGRTELVELLLKHHESNGTQNAANQRVDWGEYSNQTLVEVAFKNNNLGLVQLLLQHGATLPQGVEAEKALREAVEGELL